MVSEKRMRAANMVLDRVYVAINNKEGRVVDLKKSDFFCSKSGP
jgi:hypothetical protein